MQEVMLARVVLDRFHDQQKRIDIKKLIQEMNVKIADYTKDDVASGQYVIDDNGNPWIYVNRNRDIHHQRFFTAHCLGHYFLNHKSQKPATKENLNNEDSYSANRFLGELLMPEKQVRNFVRQMIRTEVMAEYFNVSKLAMECRLKNLGYKK